MIVPPLLAKASWWRVPAVVAVFNLAIELPQFFTGNLLGGGHLTDVNYLFVNVVGAALGMGVFAALPQVPAGAALVDRFRWS
ncbi:hypothetical protein [Lentzea sp. HUAS12]|uniref:hypothetical protein n=1 Tax=Lentzea sp. HUAS12 TaxID=2951806 RepID=UPI00209F3DCB|nr:hypothetical protein [Lentzea sp. HUAS12]USX55527.1 hypothetical protein ND450_15920 [Lentzea sp. HUAS12]